MLTTLARAMYVTRFDAVPPGQHATSMSPTLTVAGRANMVPMEYLRVKHVTSGNHVTIRKCEENM